MLSSSFPFLFVVAVRASSSHSGSNSSHHSKFCSFFPFEKALAIFKTFSVVRFVILPVISPAILPAILSVILPVVLSVIFNFLISSILFFVFSMCFMSKSLYLLRKSLFPLNRFKNLQSHKNFSRYFL
jgi:hypothetical protein